MHGNDIVHATPQVGAIGIAPEAPERIELEAAIAGRDDLASGGGDIGRPLLRVIPAVGIGRNRGVHAPAEEIVHGLTHGLAADVPEGEFDGCDGAVEHRAAARIFVAVHRLDQALDIERRCAKHVTGGHMVDGGGDGLRLPLHGAFAETREARIGVHAGEDEIVPPVPYQENLDAADPHACLPRRLAGALLGNQYITFR